MLIDDYKDMHPKLVSAAVKDGFGGATTCLHPETACRMIREGVQNSLSQDLTDALCEIPKHFQFDICYKEMTQAVAMSFYPGFKLIEDNIIRMETDNYFDLLTSINFVL